MSENNPLADLVVESLAKTHDRTGFDCGEEELDNFIKKFAGQYERKGLSRTYVARTADRMDVIGYYSLSSLSINFEEIPENVFKKLKIPRMPIPCILLGRLAVDQSAQGKQLGKYLLMHSFTTVLTAAEKVGSVLMIVHALHDKAKAFYKKFGFQEFVKNQLHLYLPLKDIRASLRS